MTRRLSVRERGIEPLRTFGPGEVDFSGLNPGLPGEVRRSSPVLPGDVVAFDGNGSVKTGLVVTVLTEYLQSTGDWTVFYRVRPVVKSGGWSGLASRVYPGQIDRAAALAVRS